MQLKQYGNNGPMVSRLGFGVMRLPARKKGDWGSVNFRKSTEVLRHALDLGVNFLDTHHRYHHGLSEEAIGRALKGRKGEKPIIQTKTPMYSGEKLKDYQRLLEEALEKMGVNQIDYLLNHAMTMDMFKKRGKMFFRLTDWAIKKGYIKYRGFSSHDTPENVKAFIDTGEFSAMLLSYNWMNPMMQDTIAYGESKGMGVSIMNPVGGGSLSHDTTQIKRLLPGAKTAAEVGLRYVLATPGVTLTLSGMNTLEQVEENTKTADRKTPMTDTQWEKMQAKLSKLHEKANRFCTGCGYCMPCPHGVNIPANFRLLNQARFFGLIEPAKNGFTQLQKNKDGDSSALACKECGRCLPKCPNDIDIIEQLQLVVQELSR